LLSGAFIFSLSCLLSELAAFWVVDVAGEVIFYANFAILLPLTPSGDVASIRLLSDVPMGNGVPLSLLLFSCGVYPFLNDVSCDTYQENVNNGNYKAGCNGDGVDDATNNDEVFYDSDYSWHIFLLLRIKFTKHIHGAQGEPTMQMSFFKLL
jgi:hypothetical protein